VFARSGKHGETLAGNNVSATMFPSLPRALDYIYIVPDSFSVAMWKKQLSVPLRNAIFGGIIATE
jgi:hypothetical protein